MPTKLSDHDILSLLPRAPEKRSTTELRNRLAAAGRDITPRSLQRRLIALSSTHAVVSDERGKPFGWSVAADSPANLGELSVQEAVALKLSEGFLKTAMPPDLLIDLKHHFAQADSKLKDQSLYRAWLERFRVIPANQSLEPPTIARNIQARVYEAVLKGVVLNVSYRKRGTAPAKSYDIEPLALVVRGNVTYLIALFPRAANDDVSMFPLHRILTATPTNTPIRRGHGFKLDQFILNGNIGFMPTEEQTVRLRFFDGAGAHLEETRLTANQKIRHIDDTTLQLTACLPITEQFKWWLLAFGAGVEVLAPKQLRDEFRARLSAANQRYQ